jgi:hypothetical protein
MTVNSLTLNFASHIARVCRSFRNDQRFYSLGFLMAPVRGFRGFHHLGFLKDTVVNCMISYRCSNANWLEFKPVSKLVNCDLLLLLGSSKFRSAAFVSFFWVYF